MVDAKSIWQILFTSKIALTMENVLNDHSSGLENTAATTHNEGHYDAAT